MESLCCDFCRNYLDTCFVLNCGETICAVCIQSQVKSSQIFYKDEKFLNCPNCNSITVLNTFSFDSLTKNMYLPLLLEAQGVERLCACSSTAYLECLNCEVAVCEGCRDSHASHFLLKTSLSCFEHDLELVLYCEDDRKPLCRLCLNGHFQHNVSYKGEILGKYWSSLIDVKENKENLIEGSKKLKNIDKESQTALLNFQRILERSPKTWFEEISQVLDLKELQFPINPEILMFTTENSSIAQTVKNHLSTNLSENKGFDTLTYVTRGSCDYFYYSFENRTFSYCKADKKILKWSSIVQVSSETLVITGGKKLKDSGSVSSCFELKISTNETRDLPDMLFSHSSHVSLVHNACLYVISGKSNLNVVSLNCERFFFSTNSWQSIQDINIGRSCASGTVYKDKIYIIGGCKNNSIEIYDITENVWVLHPQNLFDVFWQHLSVAVGHKILVFGGDALNDAPMRYSAMIDPDTLEVSNLEVLPVSQCWLCGWYPFVTRGNRIWVMNKEQKFLSYNIDLGEWSVFKNRMQKIK